MYRKITQIEEDFKKVDVDNDGVLSVNEIKKVLEGKDNH